MLKVTLNGKPVNQTKFKDEFDELKIQGAIDVITKDIKAGLTPAEIEQISLDFRGSADNFSVIISGDDAIVEKAELLIAG